MRASFFLGRHPNWYLPLGMAALVMVGIHQGASLLDDLLFALIDFYDSAFDEFVGAGLDLFIQFGVMAGERADTWRTALLDLIDLQAKESLAFFVALGVELLADGVLVFAALSYRASARLEPGLWRAAREMAEPFKRLARDFKALVDVELVALPLSMIAVALASLNVVFGVCQLLVTDLVGHLLGYGSVATGLGGLAALVVAVLMACTLGARAVTSMLRLAEARARAARCEGVCRTRGLWLSLVVLPACLLGALSVTPMSLFLAVGGGA